MDAVEFLKAKDRICNDFNCKNKYCILEKVCEDPTKHEEEVKLVEQWLKNNPELKSCPFCGGKAKIETELAFTTDFTVNRYKLCCKNCLMETKWFITENEAITAWNKRI